MFQRHKHTYLTEGDNHRHSEQTWCPPHIDGLYRSQVSLCGHSRMQYRNRLRCKFGTRTHDFGLEYNITSNEIHPGQQCFRRQKGVGKYAKWLGHCLIASQTRATGVHNYSTASEWITTAWLNSIKHHLFSKARNKCHHTRDETSSPSARKACDARGHDS